MNTVPYAENTVFFHLFPRNAFSSLKYILEIPKRNPGQECIDDVQFNIESYVMRTDPEVEMTSVTFGACNHVL